MKKLEITWDGISDSTGFLHSFAKSLACAVKHSPWPEYARDIVATSGLAFRMWVQPELCPSSTSDWDWGSQKLWVENSGLSCSYFEGGWDEDNAEKRGAAVELIKTSIDNNIPAILWCVSIPEWGLVTGYDDEKQAFSTLAAFNGEGVLPYDQLGKGEIPVLSVLTLTGKAENSRDNILRGTLKLAVSHLKGEDKCSNPSGLQAYPTLIKHFEPEYNPDASWNLEYLMGTYGALKYYAWDYFKKENATDLSALYEEVYKSWLEAFKIKKAQDASDPSVRAKIASLLRGAYENEKKALNIMQEFVG